MRWLIEEHSLDNLELLKNESIFHVANGYIGIRGNFEEEYGKEYKTIRGTYMNAFHEVDEITYGEKLFGFPDTKQKLVNLIDAQTIEFYIGDERFSLFEGEILAYSRTFHLKEGYTLREIHWRSPKNHEIKIRIKRMTSITHLELFLIHYEIESMNYEGEIKLVSTLNGDVSNFVDDNDPRIASGHAKSLDVDVVEVKDGIVTISAKTQYSKLEVACNAYHIISQSAVFSYETSEGYIGTIINTPIRPGESIALDKYVIYTDTLRYDEPVTKGIEICAQVSGQSADDWFKNQKSYLEDFWKYSDVLIEGNKLLQQGIRYNIYQLLQSVGKDKFSNITAKGLSGEGYEGHYFWDTEIYMFPFFLLTKPEIAKNLLRYRYEILDSARKRARQLGHKKGASYPWRTITGDECSGFFEAGTAQYHINADIAYAFIKYYLVTNDLDFMKKFGTEVLFETARIWFDMGHFDEEKFKIDAVTGPDEYTCIVNNNYYTNVMAKYNLKWAVKMFHIVRKEDETVLKGIMNKIGLEEEEISDWKNAYKNMYLPYDEQRDINLQDDSFLRKAVWDFENTPKEKYPLLLHYHPLTIYRYQVCKQADAVLAHFLLEDEAKLSTIKNSYNYYEKITTHDSSLSSCIFSIMAAKVGYLDKAYDYFMESARLDLDNTHGNTRDGIHTANMGGTYLGIVYGFAGLRIKEQGISFQPMIPKQWSAYTFRIGYQGRLIRIHITYESINIQLEKGEALDIRVFDTHYELQDQLQILLQKK
jgi:alpha,alpha-trehalose phosphorylase